jgi:BON domain
MSNYQTQFGSTTFNSAADADLLLRIGIALAARQRAAWRVVRVAAQNGIVRLEGIVPTFYDRQLILAVAQHVAGVLSVEDELAIDDPTVRQPPASTAPANTEFVAAVEAQSGTEVKQATPQNAFFHLPVLDESLEDILAKRAANIADAG